MCRRQDSNQTIPQHNCATNMRSEHSKLERVSKLHTSAFSAFSP